MPELLEFLTARDCIAYAHNGGRFDWHYLLEYVEPFTACMVIAGRLAKFKIGACEFRDSFNIMPMPLRAGGQKYEIDDWSIFEEPEREKPANRAVIRERLRTDCVYLWQMLETFFLEFGHHLTIGTASMSAWSKIADVPKPETTADFYARFAPYYFGGRVECFTPGIVREPFSIIDINSAYPYAMTFKHPYGEIPHESQSLPDSLGGVQRCFITLEAPARGAFPFRDGDLSLRFPADNGSRIFHVTGWEFLAALDTESLQRGRYAIRSVLQLPESIEFNAYLNHFYGMKTRAKEAGDTARYEFAKRFLNSLYGKFGSNPEKYSEYMLVPPRFIEQASEADGYQFCAELGPHALMSRPLAEMKQRYYNVATSASICGFVRAHDWRAMHAIRQAGETVHYIDTDAIFASDPGDVELHPTKLGAWNLEARCTFGAFGGRKLYACQKEDGSWKTASKGVRLTPDEIVRVANGEEIEHNSDVPQYSMKRGIQFVPRKIRNTARAAV